MSTRRTARDLSTGAPEVAGPALWFGLLGGAAAWAVQFLTGYLVSEGVCVGAAGTGSGVAGGSLAVLLVSAAAFVVAVLAALSGRRVWQAERDGPEGGRGWVGLAGLVLSAVFAFVIAIQVTPLFLGGGCA